MASLKPRKRALLLEKIVRPQPPAAVAPFLSDEIDDSLPFGGLALGALHELALDPGLNKKENSSIKTRSNFYLPLELPLQLIRNSINKNFLATSSLNRSLKNKKIVFIGKHSWPSPFSLEKYFGDIINWKEICFFVDPVSKEKKLFSTCLALKSPATLAVIADARFYKLLDTRRLQISVKDSKSCLALLLRKKEELSLRSAAQTRWLIEAEKLSLLYGRGSKTPQTWLKAKDSENQGSKNTSRRDSFKLESQAIQTA